MTREALVGREREIDALEEGLARLARGEGSLLLFSGEPGIGKTRMLEELSQRAARAGARVGWGRMWEMGLTPAFWPWIQALSVLETADERAPALGTLELRADAGARVARFAEVAAFLTRSATSSPIALLLDDLHAADPSSLQLLEYVVPLLAVRPVLLALAARDADASPEVATVLGRIQRSARRLPLARLQVGEVRALVGERADGARVFELSDGNPLFVSELLAAQRAEGVLRLPALSSVRAVIRERVAALPEATRTALVAAAVVGRDFRGQVVADMVATETDGLGLRPALALGMIAMTSPDRYRFSHALVAEALAEELEPSERARLHLRAAQAVERREQSDTLSVAHHLLAAGHLAAEAAVTAAERAARECMERLAFEDAAALLARAAQALTLSDPGDRRHRAVLLCSRAEALQHATEHALALELCDEAAALARALAAEAPATDGSPPSDELFARIALARGLEFRFGRTDPRLVALLGEALERLGAGAPALRARLLARLAAAEQPARDPSEPVARALEAIELARTLPARDRLDVTYVATAALVDYVRPEVLDPIHHEVLELARGVDRQITVHTRLRLCFTAVERVDRGLLAEAILAFTAEAEALALPQWLRYQPMLEAMTAILDGRFADAERAAARSEAYTPPSDASAAWLLKIHRAMLGWVRTTPPDPLLRATLLEYVPGRAAIAAWFAVQEGDRETAKKSLAELGERIPDDPDLAAMMGHAVALVGDPESVTRVYERLLPRAGRVASTSMVGFCMFDLYDRILLALASASERWDALDEHGARALEVAARLGSPVWAARTQADLADALTRRGRAGDALRARDLYTEAQATAERLGMPGLLAHCRARLASGPARSVAPSGGAPRPPVAGIELAASGALWIIRGFGEEVHVKDSRGMQMIARLVAEPGRELHVLDLVGGTGAVDGGDAGPALDEKARAAYRARVAELAAERDEAESWGDRGRVERANAELEALGAELERAFGLGGRERKVGAASERARSNAQRRITHAIDHVRAASARLGEHLTATLRTGTYCVYAPRE